CGFFVAGPQGPRALGARRGRLGAEGDREPTSGRRAQGRAGRRVERRAVRRALCAPAARRKRTAAAREGAAAGEEQDLEGLSQRSSTRSPSPAYGSRQ